MTVLLNRQRWLIGSGLHSSACKCEPLGSGEKMGRPLRSCTLEDQSRLVIRSNFQRRPR